MAQTRPPSPPQPLIGADLERCIYCHGTQIVRAGKRHNRHAIMQRWYCHTCATTFSPQPAARAKVFPLKMILEAFCLFYSGHTIPRTARYLRDRFGHRIHPRTISRWLSEYRELTTYARLRPHALTRFSPHTLIRSTRLHHKQVYMYRVHQGKLALILADKEHEAFSPVATYLTEMATACPHELFQEEHRASQAAHAFDLTGVEIVEKQNLAPRIAHLALQAVTHHKRRHDELQRFMLMTDSVTVAVEVPIYLTSADIRHMQQLGFHIPITTTGTITGHIDVLQIRNGRVHILDYKPGANHERPIAQLMVYALALSRRTGLRLFDFTCAWFDDRHYFEFHPLHVVHKRRPSRRDR
jgi:ATP-dependent exoDNAse (exonuclease V) beta subunit